MLDFEEKKLIKKIIYSKLSIIIVFILFLFVAKNVYGVYKDEKLTRENKYVVQQELQELQEREDNILSEIKELNTPEGIEKEIRDKFGVVKEGEKMIMIIDEKQKDNLNFNNKNNSVWEKFKNFFDF